MTDDEDPFDRLEDAADRDGDPFDRLEARDGGAGDGEPEAAVDDTDTPPEDHDTGEGSAGTGWFDGTNADGTAADPAQTAEPGTAVDGTGSTVESGDGDGAVDPFARPDEGESDDALAQSADRGDPFEGSGDTFERMDVEGMDPDAVWTQLGGVRDQEPTDETDGADERTYAEVSKHRFCERCQYFSPPPDVSCSHEGTDILEFVDMETVRLADCPVVAERRELEEQE